MPDYIDRNHEDRARIPLGVGHRGLFPSLLYLNRFDRIDDVSSIYHVDQLSSSKRRLLTHAVNLNKTFEMRVMLSSMEQMGF